MTHQVIDKDFIIKRLNFSASQSERTDFQRKRRKINSRIQLAFVQSTIEYYQEKNESDSELFSENIDPKEENSVFTVIEQDNYFTETTPKDKTNITFHRKSIKSRAENFSDEKFEDNLKSPEPFHIRISATPLNKREFDEESNKGEGMKRKRNSIVCDTQEELKSPQLNSNRRIAFEEDDKKKNNEKRRTSLYRPLTTNVEYQPMFISEFEEAANFKQYFKNNNKDTVLLKYNMDHKGSRKKPKERKMKSKNNSELISQNFNEIKLV